MSGTARAALALAILVILAATLVPTSDVEAAGWHTCWVCGARGVADIILNIMLFMPFGAALALAGLRASRIWLLGALLSAGIEYTQLYIPGRESTIADVLSNSTGAVVGCVALLALARTLRASRPAPWQALAVSSLVVGLIATTGLLLRPSLPASTYFGQWTPNLGQFVRYRGRVLRVSLDGVSLPSRRLADGARVRQLLSARNALSVRALAGPRVTALAPLFSIVDDRQREILLLGPDRDDLVFRYRTRAAAWRLDQPALRLAGAMRAVSPGDTLDVAAQPNGHGYCLSANATRSCELGFTVGDGWALILYPGSLRPWLRAVLGIGWLAGMLLPVGYWAASRPGLVIGVGMAIVGLAVVAPLSGLLATSGREWVGAVFGFVTGAWCRDAVIRRRRPAHSSTIPDLGMRASSSQEPFTVA